ncbi:NAD-dependent epimerase/dehydratase family protein [Aquipuribacter sp. MA13-6]|uniref:NAD-dependent epimerase/dehydratase family protein n=1 Tax=unclassified Aquipuribacter TaxID=2635084 RepID=UPI003EEE2B5D
MSTDTTGGQTAADVVAGDLDHIVSGLREELAEMAGHRLLVVGGAGFLGHYLVQAAVHHNRTVDAPPIDVTVFDNYSRGMPDWLTALDGEPNLTLRTFDITEPLPADMGHYDYVIHAASIASPTYYRLHPIETMDANVNGLRTLLEYAVAQKAAGTPLKGFLFYSTSEIYGDPTPDMIPTPETYRGNVSCTGPRACYDESKRYGETLCVNFAAQHGVPVTVARPFNNYGPGLKITDGRVLSDFARDVLAGRDIVMLSDGSPTRTFCYVADAVVGYFKILVRGRAGEAYNIGTETPEISMAELADRVVAAASAELGYTGCVVRGESSDAEYLTDNPNRRCPVITKAREELGYDPTVQVDEGLRRALIWYRDNATAEDS